MSRKSFYDSEEYRLKQKEMTSRHWSAGTFDFLRKNSVRHCARPTCDRIFSTIPSDPKEYCSKGCATTVNNTGRMLSQTTKGRISSALTGRTYPDRPKSPPKTGICIRPQCGKPFVWNYWRPATRPYKYCSNACAIKDIGSRPTSPKAARAKAGVRSDIDTQTYFFSRWEANFARLMNFLGVVWEHQPKAFQLKNQRYTPDFYLPELDTYIEIKNFLSDYSKRRDEQFRGLYPEIALLLILRKDYILLQKEYAPLIENWEYSPGLPLKASN